MRPFPNDFAPYRYGKKHLNINMFNVMTEKQQHSLPIIFVLTGMRKSKLWQKGGTFFWAEKNSNHHG